MQISANKFTRFASKLLKGTALRERALGFLNRNMSYSQFGEDLHIASYYDRLAYEKHVQIKAGCIVDVGAFSPVMFSNTYYFYKRGWSSINIDATPGSKAIFDRIRPKDTNLELAIATSSGTGTFYSFGAPCVFNTMDPESAQKAESMTGIVPKQYQVEKWRLEDVLDRYLNGRSFELLTIDAEGYDIEILESNDFSKYRPRLIMVEVHGASLETIRDNEVIRYCTHRGYELYSWINPNLLFVRSDSTL